MSTSAGCRVQRLANMTDDNEKNKPDTPPAGFGDETEKQPLRKISDDELQTILAEHKKWLESGEREGKQADLSNTDLSQSHWEVTTTELERPGSVAVQGPLLRRANLKGSRLRGAVLPEINLNQANIAGADFSDCLLKRAKFQDANANGAQFENSDLNGAWLAATDLSHANLEASDLSGAYLEGAILFGATVASANFEKANLQGTLLTGVKGLSKANLQDCNFDGATGLKGTEFARADITGAKLPADIREFKSLKVVEEISKNARKIFLAMLLGCAYALLTILTTTDAKLILNSASSPLPIIGAEVPIAYFYMAAPFILIGLFIYLHLYLQRLWEGLSKLPAIFVDGKRLDERAYPWLLNGLVRRHFEKLKKGRSLMAHLEEYVSIFLAWWVVPATLGLFWYWYLVRHDWIGTSLHMGFIVLSAIAAMFFNRSHVRTLRGRKRTAFPGLRFYRERRTYQTLTLILTGFALVIGSYGAIEGLFFETEHDRWRGKTPSWVCADLSEAQLSVYPRDYWSLDEAVRDSAVIGANLRGADLKYADLWRAFLSNSDLRYSELDYAYLAYANLKGARMWAAHLNGSDLSFADLTGADLSPAMLIGANFSNANLTGVQFTLAWLTDAVFDHAILTGANLWNARGLTQSQLDQACGDTLTTKLPPGLTIKQCPVE